MEIKRNDINFERIASEVRRDGEVCDAYTVKRMFESLDRDGKAWTGSATVKEIEAWAIGVLCNTQPLINA
jgi:hypothetical protein